MIWPARGNAPDRGEEQQAQLAAINARLDRLRELLSAGNDQLAACRQACAKLSDLLLLQLTADAQRSHANPLNRFGKKCFSQADEDGITLEIVRRLGITGRGVFAEFGVGDGRENNTLILAALGWRGYWVGGEDLAFPVPDTGNFTYLKEWITDDNIASLAKAGQDHLRADHLDVVSLDLDGNDIYLVRTLLQSQVRPKLFIVEYNAKFPPPVRFQIRYDAKQTWKGDDYFGASLSSFCDLFAEHRYRLVCCNSHTGANAFFIHPDHQHLFADVPADVADIYVGPRYHLLNAHGHPPSIAVVEQILGKL